MSAGGSGLMMMTSALCTLLNIAVEVTLLITILTVVGRYRKDAVFVLASGAGLSLFGTLFSSLGYALGGAAMSRMTSSGSSGIDRFYVFNSAMHVATTLIFVSATVCILVGIVRLAKGEALPHPPGAMPS